MMQAIRLILVLATLGLVATCSSAAPQASNKYGLGKYEINTDGSGGGMNDNNDLIYYDPIDSSKPKYETTSRVNNKLKSSSFTDLERETAPNNKVLSVIDPLNKQAGGGQISVADAERSGSPNLDKIKSIAYNSREIRLVGPNQKEVEMKDDVASKVVVALDNLQKEATDVWSQVNEKLDKGWTDLKRSEVWGQVNEKLDKGWTDLKTMVEGVVAPSNNKSTAANGKQN